MQRWVGESGFIDVCYISFGIKRKITRPFEYLVYIQVVFGGGLQVFLGGAGCIYLSGSFY